MLIMDNCSFCRKVFKSRMCNLLCNQWRATGQGTFRGLVLGVESMFCSRHMTELLVNNAITPNNLKLTKGQTI